MTLPEPRHASDVLKAAADACRSPLTEAIRPVLEVKKALHADSWCAFDPCVAKGALRQLAGVIKKYCGDPGLDGEYNYRAIAQYALEEYRAGLLQTPFARRFKDMSDAEIDETLRSFRLENCVVNQDLIDEFRQYMLAE